MTGLRSTPSKLDARVASATRRLGQAVASQLLTERVAALKAKKAERQELLRRKFEFGSAVVAAGLDGWDAAEIAGALLDVKERVGGSPTQRLGFRQRGQSLLPRSVARKPKASGTPLTTALPEA